MAFVTEVKKKRKSSESRRRLPTFVSPLISCQAMLSTTARVFSGSGISSTGAAAAGGPIFFS